MVPNQHQAITWNLWELRSGETLKNTSKPISINRRQILLNIAYYYYHYYFFKHEHDEHFVRALMISTETMYQSLFSIQFHSRDSLPLAPLR